MKVSSTQIKLLRAALFLFEFAAFAIIFLVKAKPSFMYPLLTKEYEIGVDKTLTYHPILMTAAFSLFMNEGLIAFYMGDITATPRAQSRRKHGMFQLAALLTALAAYVCIYLVLEKDPTKNHFAIGRLRPSVWVHTYLGYLTLLLCIFQVAVGIRKYVLKVKTGVSVQKWHGYLGLVVYILGQANVGIGIFNCTHVDNIDNELGEGHNIAAYSLRVMMAIFVFLSVVTLLVTRHIAIKMKENANDLGVPLMYSQLPDEPVATVADKA